MKTFIEDEQNSFIIVAHQISQNELSNSFVHQVLLKCVEDWLPIASCCPVCRETIDPNHISLKDRVKRIERNSNNNHHEIFWNSILGLIFGQPIAVMYFCFFSNDVNIYSTKLYFNTVCIEFGNGVLGGLLSI